MYAGKTSACEDWEENIRNLSFTCAMKPLSFSFIFFIELVYTTKNVKFFKECVKNDVPDTFHFNSVYKYTKTF